MHRLIMNAPPKKEIDHKDGDGLNNRKENLRICTHSENIHNQKKRKNTSSKYKGVTWSKKAKKWASSIGCNYKVYNLGFFDSEMEAAKIYDKKAKELFGEFAKTNF